MTKPKETAPTPAKRRGRPSVKPGERTFQIVIRLPESLAWDLTDFTRDEMRAALSKMVDDYKNEAKGATK